MDRADLPILENTHCGQMLIENYIAAFGGVVQRQGQTVLPDQDTFQREGQSVTYDALSTLDHGVYATRFAEIRLEPGTVHMMPLVMIECSRFQSRLRSPDINVWASWFFSVSVIFSSPCKHVPATCPGRPRSDRCDGGEEAKPTRGGEVSVAMHEIG